MTRFQEHYETPSPVKEKGTMFAIGKRSNSKPANSNNDLIPSSSMTTTSSSSSLSVTTIKKRHRSPIEDTIQVALSCKKSCIEGEIIDLTDDDDVIVTFNCGKVIRDAMTKRSM
mmetsp:Transcript_505/g.568  ORF Transcript_505/g.568 Transcript_505/m.568 type:complete len:114 (-) Transcript_505:147-488(-)